MMSNDLSSISTQSSYHLTKDDVDKTGYDLHFKKKVDDDLHCNLCRYPLRLPKQSVCGCRYCSACIKRYLEEHNIDDKFDCPSCKETISSAEMVPDYRVKKQLDKQIVFCPKNLEGCQAEFPLKELEKHTDVCEFAMVKCPNQLNGCVASIRRKDLEKHLKIDCAFRLAQCKYCQERFPKLKVAVSYVWY
ncbi:TNF receptor-associated factor 4-like [Anneissia japonica]|uniref:TNF receptor-associated factor 4-like n=1 Tax=Anneissia japonica TaxID=1529436 RepID=UPI001425A201|nr:TNF receptor-associated factor 4-like [Anneissia japonica]